MGALSRDTLTEIKNKIGKHTFLFTFSLGYVGQSCESCARGYYRDYYTRIGNMGSCLPCDCNGNEQVISRKKFKNFTFIT